MITSRRMFFLGIFISIIPFLGFPSFWKTFFVMVSGLTVVFFSIKISIPKKSTRIKNKKEKITPVFVENVPIYPKDDTVESIQVSRVKTSRASKKVSVE